MVFAPWFQGAFPPHLQGSTSQDGRSLGLERLRKSYGRRLTIASQSLVQAIFWPVDSQSLRNDAMPASVIGCLNNCQMTFAGAVITSAPIFAASTTCTGWRTLATRICVGKS